MPRLPLIFDTRYRIKGSFKRRIVLILAPVITSRQNDAVKRARALARGKDTATSSLLLVEGLHLIEESLKEGVKYDTVLVSPRLEATEQGAALREHLLRAGNPVLDATDDVLESISEAAGHQGVVGLAYKRVWTLEDLLPTARMPLVVVAWGVQDPGNLGTIIRTADAAGATGVIATAHTACPFNAKCIRATMGSIFRLPVIEMQDELHAIGQLKQHKLAIFGTSVVSGVRHTDIDFDQPVAVVLGAEGAGLPTLVLGLCDQALRIPIRPEVESLNVAAAAAAILYEAARQRDFKGLV